MQNPVSNQLMIESNETPRSISVVDIKGITLMSGMQTNTIDVSKLYSGTYIVIVEDINGLSERYTFIKR